MENDSETEKLLTLIMSACENVEDKNAYDAMENALNNKHDPQAALALRILGRNIHFAMKDFFLFYQIADLTGAIKNKKDENHGE